MKSFSFQILETEPQPQHTVNNVNQRIISLKDQIGEYDIDLWKKARWYINPFDFVVQEPIINRAFFKFWEIIQFFGLLHSKMHKICALAEAPGGFIQGIHTFFDANVSNESTTSNRTEDEWSVVKGKTRNSHPSIYTISLNRLHPAFSSFNLPSYNKSIVRRNVHITYGKDKTGDICRIENLQYFQEFTGKIEFDFISADGGFDEGNDFNNKEQLHYSLFLAQVLYALSLQKHGGNFLLKMFDLYTPTSQQLIWILYNSYNEVDICKPKTSRPTNSEKYIACRGFRLTSSARHDVVNKLKSALSSIQSFKDTHGRKLVSFTLFESIPDAFLSQLISCNELFAADQEFHLTTALRYVRDPDFPKIFHSRRAETQQSKSDVFKDWSTSSKLPEFCING